MATVLTTTYSTNTAIVMNLSALAASATSIAGRESTQIDNTSNKYMNALVQGSFTVGTTPAITGGLTVYVWGADTSLGTTPLGTLDGTDSDEALTTTQLGMLRLASFTPVLVNTSDTKYWITPFTVAELFGGVMPKFWGLYVAHSTTAALKTDAANTDSFSYTGITYTQT
jgi:hypothetical protein